VASTEDDVVVRLRLKDVKQFIADVKAGKLAIDDLEKKVKKAGQTASRETGASGGLGKLGAHFGMLAGFARTGALALGAATVGVAGYAVKSAASLEQVTVAFTTMLHSASAANTMVANLQKFAKDTPFELAGVESTAQSLLGFGFAAKSVIPMLTAVGNAASGLNLGQAGMDEITLALGQMKMKGRVQGDELLQLAEHHVNAYGYLEKALGLSGPQLQKAVQKGKVSAATAIPIILKGMDDQFKGLMEKESHTLGGIWSNFHDAMQQGLTRLVNPFLPTMKKWLQGVTDYLGGKGGKDKGMLGRLGQFAPYLASNITSGRADFAAYNIGAILGNHKFDPAIEKGVRVAHNLGVIVKDVLVPAFKDMSVLLAPVVLVFDHLDQITGFVADHKDVFRVLADGVIAVVAAFKLYQLVMVGVNAITAVFDGLADANPIGLIVVAIAALVAGFVYAYTHWAPFRNFINDSWRRLQVVAAWIRDHWETLALFTPFTLAIRVVHDHWGTITGALRSVWNFINKDWPLISAILVKPFEDLIAAFQRVIDAYNNTIGPVQATQGLASGMSWQDRLGLVGSAVTGNIGGVIGAIANGAKGSANQASGGTTVRSGMSWVGERGPELLNLPRGAKVIPLPRVPEFAGGRHIEIPVMLNGREIARAVYDDMDDRMARR
jgi:tape measure domain-containing protein